MKKLVSIVGPARWSGIQRLAFALALGLLWPPLAPAQDASPTPAPSSSPSPRPTAAEYIEVTATRIPEEAESVPASITVITGQELRDWGGTDLRSALALAAGVDVAPGGDGGPASAVPELWGLKEIDAFLLVVDGVPWGGAFNPALSTLSLDDVERVEVVRGAAPVMYGATSFVGVIHVVRRGAGESRGSATASGGSYGSGGARVEAKLPSFWGLASSLDLDAGRQGFRDDRTEWRRGHLLWRNQRVVGRGVLRFDVDGTWLDQDPASPHPRQGTRLSPLVPLDANHNPEGAFLDERRAAVSAGYDRTLGGVQWSTLASFTRSHQTALRGFLTDVSGAAPDARGLRETIDVTDLYVDTHVEWTRSRRVKVVAGIDHLHGEGEARGGDFDYFVPLDGSNPPASASLPPASEVRIGDRREFSGAYAFAEWNPAAAWRFEAGVRLNRTHETREGEAGPETGDTGDEGERTDLRLSGSVAASWTAWSRGRDHLRLFANYRNTFKPAAVDFGIGEAEGEEGGGILDPETARSYEVGVKSRLLDDRLSLQASSFLMDFDNLVLPQNVGGLPALVNAGQQRFKGLELAAALRLPDHVSLRAAYSLHDARFRDFLTAFDGVPTQLAGKRLEMSARQMGSAGLAYSPERGLAGAVKVVWVGSRFLDKRNRALADGYATVEALLAWRAARWEVRLDGRNLGDERPPVAESELGDAQYYLLPARRVDLSATLRF